MVVKKTITNTHLTHYLMSIYYMLGASHIFMIETLLMH